MGVNGLTTRSGRPPSGSPTSAEPASADRRPCRLGPVAGETGEPDVPPAAPVSTATTLPTAAACPPWPAVPVTSAVPVWGPVVRRRTADDQPADRSRGQAPSGCGWWLAWWPPLVGAVIGGGIVAASEHGGGTTTVKEISAGPALLNGTTNIETVIDKVLPAVVSIDAKSPEPASDSLFGRAPVGCRRTRGPG